MKVLFVPSCTMRCAGPRYRIQQYLPYLEEKRVSYRVFPIISDGCSRQMIQSPGYGSLKKLLYYLRTIGEKLIRYPLVLFFASQADVIFLQRTTLPFGLEKLLPLVNENIIFDIDDAIFLPDEEGGGLIHRLKKRSKEKEVIGILRISRKVVVENHYIKRWISRFCENVSIITGPIDERRNHPLNNERSQRDGIVIGWIGSPSTTPYLRMLDRVFQRISEKYPKVLVRVIGATPYKLKGVRLDFRPWSYDNEVRELQGFDIGIMPMPDNNWTRGKTGVKMLQYMAVGIPAIVSCTEANLEVIRDGENGFLANSDDEWFNKLSLLIKRPELRRKLGIAGRKTIEEKYSVEVSAPKFLEIMKTTPAT